MTSAYWLHLEDDWHFFVRDRYVSKAIAILEHDPRIGQVLFNRNYGETLDCRAIAGGRCGRRTTGCAIAVHEYADRRDDDTPTNVRDIAPGALSNAWWPHFSLRPSLVRTAALAELGACTGSTGHFELELAKEYTARGSASAFFDAINCLHLGPLTSEHAGTQPSERVRPERRAAVRRSTRRATTPSTYPVDDVRGDQPGPAPRIGGRPSCTPRPRRSARTSFASVAVSRRSTARPSFRRRRSSGCFTATTSGRDGG